MAAMFDPDRYHVEIRPVKRARLRVMADGAVRVTAPPGFDTAVFIEANRDWIERTCTRLDEYASGGAGFEHHLLLRGCWYRLARDPQVVIDPVSATVRCPSPARLKRTLSEMVQNEVTYCADRYSSLMGTPHGRITVRMQRTRWGSCSAKGNLSFNLKMIALPDHLRRYLIVHETAHLVEPHHGRAFWALVGTYFPEYRRAEAELKRFWVIIERNRIWQAISGNGGLNKPFSRASLVSGLPADKICEVCGDPDRHRH